MNAYFNLFYMQHAVKFPARVAVLGSPVAMVGGWLVRKPSRKAV